MKDAIFDTAKEAVTLLRQNGMSVATAESCTGGMLSGFITSVPGASCVFELGITSYSPRIKYKVLGVKSDILNQYGAVSRHTAAEMASHVRAIAGSDLGVSVTGVAGPDASEGKLPGTVYIALADKKTVRIEKLSIEPQSRDAVRRSACEAVLSMIIIYLKRGNTND